MSNVGNERGEILNSVLTTGEGAGIQKMCQGIVKCYADAGEAHQIWSTLTKIVVVAQETLQLLSGFSYVVIG